MSRQSAHAGGEVFSLTNRPPLSPEKIPGTHFYYRLSRPQGHNETGRINSLKNHSDAVGSQTRDCPACGAMRGPNSPRSTPFKTCGVVEYSFNTKLVEWSASSLCRFVPAKEKPRY
jgi:hypothetical protein